MKKQQKIILETLETILTLQLESVIRALGDDKTQVVTPRRRERKRKSMIDLSVDILTDKQCAVHVDELVNILADRYGRVTDRDSLSSALAKKAKQGILVRRVSPATFELLKLNLEENYD